MHTFLKQFALCFAAFCLFFSSVIAEAGKPFSSLIDAEAELVLSIRNISELRATLETHPITEVLKDPELADFLRAVTGAEADSGEKGWSGFETVMQEEFGLDYADLFELLPGQASFVFYNVSEVFVPGSSERENPAVPEILIMAEFSGDAERLNELMKIQFDRNAASQKETNPEMEHILLEAIFMGETLYLDEAFDGEKTYIEDGYALVDGIFVLATPESRLRDAVEAIKMGPRNPLARYSSYEQTIEFGGQNDLLFWINLERIGQSLNRALDGLPALPGLAMFGVTPSSLQNALALESMEAAFFGADFRDKSVFGYSGLLYHDKAGLLSLLTYTDKGLPRASYVPESVLSSSISAFDLSAMLANFEKLLAVASPNLPVLIDMQLQQLQSSSGLDLRAALLENMGGEVVTFSVLPTDSRERSGELEPQELYIVEIRDTQTLSLALETLKDSIPGVRSFFEIQDFEGTPVHTFHNQTGPDGKAIEFSYAITRSHLLVCTGPVGLLAKTLNRQQRARQGFWDSASTEALFEPIAGPNAVSRNFFDVSQAVETILESVLENTQRLNTGRGRSTVAKPPKSLELPFQMASEWSETNSGIFSRSVLTLAEEGK